MPPDVVLKTMNTVHRLLIRVSGGRIGHEFEGMPSLELTTTGRKFTSRTAPAGLGPWRP